MMLKIERVVDFIYEELTMQDWDCKIIKNRYIELDIENDLSELCLIEENLQNVLNEITEKCNIYLNYEIIGDVVQIYPLL